LFCFRLTTNLISAPDPILAIKYFMTPFIWVLRDYAQGAVLASGDAALGASPPGALGANVWGGSQMAGPTLAVGIVGGVEVLSSATGQPLGTVVSPAWYSTPMQSGGSALSGGQTWQLASDGSYVAMATQTELAVYSPSGQLLCSRSGAYFLPSQQLIAAPGQVQVADGPAGANTIEAITVPGCTSTVSAAFQGSFEQWFGDGSQFITRTNGTVWVYSSSGTLEATEEPPELQGSNSGNNPGSVGGTGNWIWTVVGNVLNIYAVGSASPALTLSDSGQDIAGYQLSGTTIMAFPLQNTIRVIDLSGSTPVETDYALPQPSDHSATASAYGPLSAFAAESSTKWVAASSWTWASPILDGASLASSSPRYLGRGGILAIAGSSTDVAIATNDGQITYFDPSNPVLLGSIGDFDANDLALSTDGTVLAASSGDNTLLNTYSLPSGSLSQSFSFPSQSSPGTLAYLDTTLSGSGNNLGIVISPNAAVGYEPQVLPASGGAPIWSGAPNTYVMAPVYLSPDGTLAAVTEGDEPNTVVTIYQNGQILAAVGGVAAGWLDNGRLLVNNYASGSPSGTMTIYSPSGALLATTSLPELPRFQPLTSDTIYSPDRNAIYSLTTGTATWTSPYLSDFGQPDIDVLNNGVGTNDGRGAAGGSYIVFEWQGQVIAVPQ
jgi:hypothetical protein